MSLKNLFTQKVVSTNTIENVEKNVVESKDYIDQYTIQKNKFVPKIDFLTASNFVSFGSAEEYYRQSLARIYNTYPYDGSKSEKLKWQNEASYLDQYIFDVRYPKSTGYISFSPTGWGASASSNVDGYGNPTTKEYITIKGGPNTGSEALESKPLSSLFDLSNKWDTTLNRTSNLSFDLSNSGSTIEFWLKKPAFITGSTQKEVILDIWNNNASSSSDYARLTLELTGAGNPFLLTVQSGAAGVFRANISSLTTSSLENWHHYAVSMTNSSSQLEVKFYVDGALQTTTLTGSSIGEVNGALVANIGSLYTAPSGTSGASIGWGKLSGSIDEFRFWKMKRTSEHVGHYWWTNVDGGTNTDDYSTNLGVYYKFNEGILGTSSTDSLVLDYSGRVSNGAWVGYTSAGRNSGSAINEYFNDTTKELGDPIINSSHSLVSDLQTELVNSGSAHDYNNSSYLFNTLPSWVIEEDEVNGSTAKKLFQIISSYFDTLSLQIKELNKIKDYYSDLNDESKPYSFSNQLLDANGLITPNIFIDATIFEELLHRDEVRNYDEKLYDLKNHIYQNIYNSLIAIYKSKGTEKAYRNFLHAYGIDEKLIKINLYANNETLTFDDSVQTTSKKKKLVDFNSSDRFYSTVYQYQNDVNDWSFISGTLSDDKESLLGLTVEGLISFPKQLETADSFRNKQFVTSSLFGVHTAVTSSQTDLTWNSTDSCNFQVTFVKLGENSDDGYFQLSSSNPYPIPVLTSSVFYDVYNNTNWNISVRLKNNKHPYSNLLSGSDSNDYTLEFMGLNVIGNRTLESFYTTSSISNTTANSLLSENKRFYVGAERLNYTGSLIAGTDVKVGDFKVWLNYLTDTEIQNHARNIENEGTEEPVKNYALFNNSITNTEIPSAQSLILHWDFENVTGSDAGSGNPLLNDASFTVTDTVYNSDAVSTNRYEDWFSTIKYRNYPGKGDFFLPNKTNVIDIDYITQDKIVDPEIINSSDTIKVLSGEEIVFGRNIKPIEYKVLFEKSMYQVISEEMLTMFSNVVSFNELVGNVYNKYRSQYKDLNHLRQLFFEKVKNEPDLDKFIEFYKWFDSSIGIFLNQLTPVSAEIDNKLHIVVEETLLKRNKLKHAFPTMEFKVPELESGAEAVNRLLYNWRLGFRPLSGTEPEHAFWWKERAERELLPPTSSVLTSRSLILSASTSALTRRYTTPVRYNVETAKTFGGGTNYYTNTKVNFLDIAVSPHGPLDTDAISSVPANYLFVGITDTSSLLQNISDVVLPNNKIKYSFPVVHGRDYLSSSLSYGEKLKSDISLPVNFVSGNLTDGYQADVSSNFMNGVIITNVHNDTYGPQKETSIQGPFTNQWVGGRQSRHVSVNRGVDTYTTRPEAWKLLMGTGSFSGSYQTAIGFVGADYPHPEGNPSEPSYPVLTHRRATYYREETAKRPVNIRNIITNTSSYEIGNYTEPYEVIMAVSRTSNNRLLRDSILAGVDTNKTELSGVLRTLGGTNAGRVDFALQNRSGSVVIGSRFSAPGGSRYTSRGFLNYGAEELSPYNALTFRNREVIGSSHNNGLPYSAYAVSGSSGTGSMAMLAKPADRTGYISGSTSVAPLHKQNRNTTYYVKAEQFKTKLDNGYVSHQIPRKDTGYSWVYNSIANVETASKNIWEHYRHADNVQYTQSNAITSSILGYRIGSVSGAVSNYTVPQDLAGLNIIIVEPYNTSSNTIGASSIGSSTSSFITTVPTSSNLFNSIIIHRNGVYGYPSFKQLSFHRNDKVAEYLRKNNFIQTVDVADNDTVQTYSESIIENSNHPLQIEAYVDSQPINSSSNIFDIKASFENIYSKFSNFDLNRELNLQNYIDDSKGLLNSLLLTQSYSDFYYQPISVQYKKRIFPISTSQNRKRTSFVHSYWRDSRTNRDFKGYTFQNYTLNTASIWPLDSRNNFTSTTASYVTIGTSSEGVLQNSYALRYSGSGLPLGLPLYFYKQSVVAPSSTKSPSGISDSYLPIPTTEISESILFTNSTLWEANNVVGNSNTPFSDNYDTWLDGAEKQKKDYSVLPEYRISEKIPTLIINNFSISSVDENYLEITGSNIYAATSSNDLVGAAYIEKTIENVSVYKKPKIQFTLTCETFEKFLPYNGFYPVERTLDIANAFSESYSNYIDVISGSTLLRVSNTDSKFKSYYRVMSQPLFGPGLLYNTIKAGVAVDYPVLTSSLTSVAYKHQTSVTASSYMIGNNTFDVRLPFETLLKPETYLNGISLVDMNPHPSASLPTISASLNASNGDNKYKLMINNFLAETTNLFLKNRAPSTITSKAIAGANAKNGKKYQALLKLYKTTKNSINLLSTVQGSTSYNYARPQYISSAEENITMFSNPLGFGPPCSSGTGSANVSNGYDSTAGYNAPFTPPYYDGESWAIIEFAPTETRFYSLDEIIASSSTRYIRYEFDRAPNVYDNLTGTIGPQGSLYMNQNAMQITASIDLFNVVDANDIISEFSPTGKIQALTSNTNRSKKKWEISSKFETPILNFHPRATGYTLSQAGVGISGSDFGLANAGMWLQYGVLPTADQGIYMQISDVPVAYRKNGSYGYSGSLAPNTTYKPYNEANGISVSNIESLVDLVGFSTTPVKLGEVADNRVIKEGIVVVPYTIDNNTSQRMFLKLDSTKVHDYLNGLDSDLSDTTKEQISKLSDYVLPLHLDYINNLNVAPIAMYVFEIEKTLSQTDLSDIWQNLMPQSLKSYTTGSYTVTHTLDTSEMIDTFNVNDDTTIKFMCFKVKQRGITKYEFTNGNDEVSTTNVISNLSIQNTKVLKQNLKKFKFSPITQQKTIAQFLPQAGLDKDLIGYNWPYDYYSLVETAKIDATVKFEDFNNEGVSEGLNLKAQINPMTPNLATNTNTNSSTYSPHVKLGNPTDKPKIAEQAANSSEISVIAPIVAGTAKVSDFGAITNKTSTNSLMTPMKIKR